MAEGDGGKCFWVVAKVIVVRFASRVARVLVRSGRLLSLLCSFRSAGFSSPHCCDRGESGLVELSKVLKVSAVAAAITLANTVPARWPPRRGEVEFQLPLPISQLNSVLSARPPCPAVSTAPKHKNVVGRPSRPELL